MSDGITDMMSESPEGRCIYKPTERLLKTLGFVMRFEYPNTWSLFLADDAELVYRLGHPDDIECFIETVNGDDIILNVESYGQLSNLVEILYKA